MKYILVLVALAAVVQGPIRVSAQTTAAADEEQAQAYLPAENQLPGGFVHQPQYDRVIQEPGLARIFRMYTRGHPEDPTDEHASILVGVAVSDTVDEAVAEYEDAANALATKGYDVTPLDGSIGEQAIGAQWDLYAETDHPKTAAIVHYRDGRFNVSVQWTDDPDQPVLDLALRAAKAIENQQPLG